MDGGCSKFKLPDPKKTNDTGKCRVQALLVSGGLKRSLFDLLRITEIRQRRAAPLASAKPAIHLQGQAPRDMATLTQGALKAIIAAGSAEAVPKPVLKVGSHQRDTFEAREGTDLGRGAGDGGRSRSRGGGRCVALWRGSRQPGSR